MPIFLSSFMIPAGSPIALEDKYVRGGYMVLASSTERDNLHSMAKKPGMLVRTQDDGKIWELQNDKTTWNEMDFGSSSFGSEFTTNNDGDIVLSVPVSASEGQALVLDSNKRPVWATITQDGGAVPSYSGPVRATANHTTGSIAPDASADFVLNMAKTCILLKLSVDSPEVEIQIHSTSNRNDRNPYRFVSAAGLLSDDGTSKLIDGSTQYNRRYAILSNLENTVSDKMYARVTNLSTAAKTVTVSTEYLTLEE